MTTDDTAPGPASPRDDGPGGVPFASPPHIATPRLMLTEQRHEDFDPFAEMWADPAFVRHIGGKPSSRQESWARLLRNRGMWPILGYGYWAVRERETGRFIGEVGFADLHRATTPSIEEVPEAGWVLAPWAHGNGYANEAVAAALEWFDRSNQFQKTVCLIDSDNLASIKVAKRHGFQRTGEVELDGKKVPLFTRYRMSEGG